MRGYIALYKSPRGDSLVVKSLSPPPEVRKFRVAGGTRKFKRVSYKIQLQEVIIVAKSTKAAKNKKSAEVTDDEIDELDGLEDLDEELEEDEDVEEEDEDEEDEDEDEEEDDDEDEEEEEPAPKKSKKRQSQAAKNGKVGTAELAEDLGIDSRTLRMVLRKLRENDDTYAPDSETGRYQWNSLKDPQVKKIKKAIKDGLDKQIKSESLQKLKERKEAERASAKEKTDKKSAKSTTGKKKTKKTK
jgi:hypothetical protein